ncbi:MAG TPA: hypothetical protein VKS21_11705 [Spirochaetota bacterium]|nr:hypothetical protein [Spirochaetota bacterium]
MKSTKYILAVIASFLSMGVIGLIWHYFLMKELNLGFLLALQGENQVFTNFWLWYTFYLITVLIISLGLAYYYRVFYNFGSPVTAGLSFGFFSGLLCCLVAIPLLIVFASVAFLAMEVLGVMLQFILAGVLIGIIWGTDSSN